VPQTSLELSLLDLARTGTLVKDRGYRQVWRFEHDGKAYYLKFYRRSGLRDAGRRLFRGSPAAREFQRLQWLQKAGINAPRAVAYLMGFKMNAPDGGTIDGDAVILEAIEPSVPLEQFLSERDVDGRPVPEHRDLASQVIGLVYSLGKAKLGHDDLHLGNFLLHEGKVFLIDAYAVRRGGLRMADVMQLGASVSRFATRTDLVRGWRALGAGDRPPEENPVGLKLWRDLLSRTGGDNRYFGRLEFGDWRGIFFRQTKHPRRWSAASRLNITEANWQQGWPNMIAEIETDTMPVLKRSRSADVLGTALPLGGTTLDVVIKRPIRRYWYRYLNEIGRGARARRAWFKAWDLIVRDLPTAWPLAFFEKRRFGYVVDTLIIFERVPGPTLWTIDLDALASEDRERLFRRTGHILRQLERFGFAHFDAKASNWIVRPDPALGASPVLIDVDGVRRRQWIALGIRRLLRSMREKKQYTPEDSLALCLGYAPFTRVQREDPCPNCGEDLGDDAAETCPKCGARVDGSQDETGVVEMARAADSEKDHSNPD
jgi:tRNA A-37 threonylcarbamoyl transferase component Bud32